MVVLLLGDVEVSLPSDVKTVINLKAREINIDESFDRSALKRAIVKKNRTMTGQSRRRGREGGGGEEKSIFSSFCAKT